MADLPREDPSPGLRRDRASRRSPALSKRRPLDVRVRPWVGLFIATVVLIVWLRFWDALTSLSLILLGAGILASCVLPLVDQLRAPRWLTGTTLSLMLLLSIMGALSAAAWVVGDAIRGELEHWTEIRDSLEGLLERQLGAVGIEVTVDLDALLQQGRDWLLPDTEVDAWLQVSQGLGSLLLVLALLVFGTIYIAAQPRGQTAHQISLLLPRTERHRVAPTFQSLERRLRWWLLGVLVSMTLVGLLAWLGFRLVGLRVTATLAVAAALGEIVPVLGPSSVFLAAFLIAGTQSVQVMVGVAIVWLVIQTVESYVVLPIVMRRAVHLPPLVTIFSLVLWARLLGFAGLLLALPINLLIWSVLEQFVIERHGRA